MDEVRKLKKNGKRKKKKLGHGESNPGHLRDKQVSLPLDHGRL